MTSAATPPDTDDTESDDPELDVEIIESALGGVKPWDPKKIRITTKPFSLRETVDQLSAGEIDLSPDFQREYVWSPRQKTRLIESLLLGIPLPAFYFNQNPDGTYQVVDGVQRLTTISLFMRNEHILSLNDLEYLKDLDGKRYRNLDQVTERRFRSTQIVVHVIEPQTPEDVKFDIFSRVNTQGSPLTAQEIRHAMSKDRSRKLLKELTESHEFDSATGRYFYKREHGELVRNGHRMTDRELALRFFAFRHYEEAKYREYSGLDAYLVEFTRRIDRRASADNNLTDERLGQLRADFLLAMKNATAVLGRAAFRRWPPNQQRRGPINRAVFESQALALSDYKTAEVIPRAGEIVLAFRKLFDQEDYRRAVTQGTGDPGNISLRLKRTREALAGALG